MTQYFELRGEVMPEGQSSVFGKPIISNSRSIRYQELGHTAYSVCGHTAKDTLFSWLDIKDKSKPCYCAFPKFYKNKNYFDELTSERKVTKYVNGRAISRYIPAGHKRNEALDCRVYAMAAYYHIIGQGLNPEEIINVVTS